MFLLSYGTRKKYDAGRNTLFHVILHNKLENLSLNESIYLRTERPLVSSGEE
jgi:hypothetical protein